MRGEASKDCAFGKTSGRDGRSLKLAIRLCAQSDGPCMTDTNIVSVNLATTSTNRRIKQHGVSLEKSYAIMLCCTRQIKADGTRLLEVICGLPAEWRKIRSSG